MTKSQNTSRRDLLLGLVGLSTVAWGWQKFVHRAPELAFQSHPDLPGWRMVVGQAPTSGSPANAVFLGIGEKAPEPLPQDALCAVLYRSPGNGRPVTVFTDIQCPNCRSLEAKLAARSDDVTITWLQLPLFGPLSEDAARLAIASEQLLGPTSKLPLALRGNSVSAWIQQYASHVGLDADVMNARMYAPEVTETLKVHRQAAETLGVWGTPAMTIGKTLVMGDVSAETLDALLEVEHPSCR